MTVGATPSGVPPGVSASNDSESAVWCISSVPGGMTTGALPVGLISLSDSYPEDREGYEASGDDNRLKLSKGNQNAVIKTL
jgi:hypothetical protein